MDISAEVSLDSNPIGLLDIPGQFPDLGTKLSWSMLSGRHPMSLITRSRLHFENYARGLDLEQVYKDQDPDFFVGKGIKIGVVRRFIEDIPL